MKVCCIGECMVEFSSGLQGGYDQSFAGDTANTAIYLSRLGAKTSYFTAIGNDSLSKKMIIFLKKEKINTNLIFQNTTKTLGLYIIENDKSGERNFLYWRSDSSARTLFENIDVEKKYKFFLNFDAIYFSGITLSLYENKNLSKFYKFISLLKKNGIQIYMDLNIRVKSWKEDKSINNIIKKFSLLCNIIFISNEDLKYLKIKKINSFIKNFTKKSLVIFRHGNGIISTFHKKQINKYKFKFENNVIDTTGCGDAFNASFLISYFEKNELGVCIENAHKLGKKVSFHKGAILKK